MPIQATAETHRAVGVTAAAPWRVKEMTVVSDDRLAVTFQDGTRGFADFDPAWMYDEVQDGKAWCVPI